MALDSPRSPPRQSSPPDSMTASAWEQPRFNVKSFEVHASVGTNGTPGMLDAFCARIENILHRQHKELLADIAKRDDLMMEKMGSSFSVDTSGNFRKVAPASVVSHKTVSRRDISASQTPSISPSMAPSHAPSAARFSTLDNEVILVGDERNSVVTDASFRASMVVDSPTLGTVWDLDEEDQQRKQAAEQVDAKSEAMEYEDEELAEQLDVIKVGWKRRILKFVASSEFELTFAILILTNSVYIGVQVDWVSRNPGAKNPLAFRFVENFYAAIFLLELLLRLSAEGSHFCSSSSWHWNILDLFLVLASIFEVITEMVAAMSENNAGLQNTSNIRIIRIVRVARLMRIFRILRVVRFVRGLRTLLFSIMCTLKSLVWAMLLLLIIIYVFGILFTQAVNDYLVGGDEESFQIQDGANSILRQYFGSLPTSMYTLFESVSGGLSWGVMRNPITDVGVALTCVFTVYVAFVYFAVLNVVTGVFCNAAIESAQHDQDMVIQNELANKKKYVAKVRQLFEDIDSDSSGTITLNEFECHFQDESVQAYFASLDLDPKDAWTLFKLLDADCRHQVDIEEFALGCLRLRGPAKRIDIEKLMYDHQRIVRGLAAFSKLVEHQLQVIVGETSRLTVGSARASNTRGSLIDARYYMDDLKDMANTSPGQRFPDITEMPHPKKGRRKDKNSRRSSRGSSIRDSLSSSLPSSLPSVLSLTASTSSAFRGWQLPTSMLRAAGRTSKMSTQSSSNAITSSPPYDSSCGQENATTL